MTAPTIGKLWGRPWWSWPARSRRGERTSRAPVSPAPAQPTLSAPAATSADIAALRQHVDGASTRSQNQLRRRRGASQASRATSQAPRRAMVRPGRDGLHDRQHDRDQAEAGSGREARARERSTGATRSSAAARARRAGRSRIQGSARRRTSRAFNEALMPHFKDGRSVRMFDRVRAPTGTRLPEGRPAREDLQRRARHRDLRRRRRAAS
jgi:hypothetical protein